MTHALDDHKTWLLEEIAKSRDLFLQRRREGERDLAIFIASGCLKNMLEYSVVAATGAAECSRHLHGLAAGLLFEQFLEEVSSDDLASHEIDLVAIPALLGDISLAVHYVREKLIPCRNTKFWAEYLRGIMCLIDGKPYVEHAMKTKGFENHWRVYLSYLEALSLKADTNHAVSAVAASFRKFNGDRRIFNYGEIDPSGNRQLGWDCRICYLGLIAEGVRQ